MAGKRINKVEDLSALTVSELEKIVYPVGFFRNKAKYLSQLPGVLQDTFAGQVPDDVDSLVKLPGVRRKTANVVLGAVFNTPGIVVDTHVGRISQRLFFTTHKDPVKIEFDLMPIIPQSEWSDFSLRLVFFGREICSARKPKCPICPLSQLCPWPDKTV